jgi:hypothetical protein
MQSDRRLIYFPIIHTEADMGQFGDDLRKATLSSLGPGFWKRKQYSTNLMWERIEKNIGDLGIPLKNVRLYQDGLPVCGREKEIVGDLANAGSRNHILLIEMMGKGAILMGTESAELLIREYDLLKQTMAIDNGPDREEFLSEQKKISEQILIDRNRFIASRINNTLGTGETGILFLGMLHNLDGLLDMEIRVTYPLYKPAFTERGYDGKN